MSTFRAADSESPPSAWLLALLLGGVMAIAFSPLRADDAYIVGRYVHQLYAGHGIVYNVGERVSALTSPGHMFVLAAIGATTDNYVDAYRFGAAVFAAGSLLWLSYRAWGGSYRFALFVAFVVASPIATFWAVGGLETPLLMTVCASMAFIATSPAFRENDGWAWRVVLLGAIAVLLRFDASLFAAPVVLSVLLTHWRDPRVIAATVAGACLVGGWLLFSLVYFGDILPTSFYVKAGHVPKGDEALKGVIYLASFAVLSWLWVPLVSERRGREVAPGNGRGQQRALYVGLGIVTLYAVWASTKHMMYLYRLLVPYLPVLAYVVLQRRRGPSRLSTPIVVGGVLLAQAGLAGAIYFQSQNPSLSLLQEGRSERGERFEFSHVGARHTAQFLSLVEAQASDLEQHWASANPPPRAPRMLVLTGGRLPYLVPDSYVFEKLVSYRHACRPEVAAAADYIQVVYPESEVGSVAAERERQGRQLVSHRSFAATGFRDAPVTINVELWYRLADGPIPLPGRVGGACP